MPTTSKELRDEADFNHSREIARIDELLPIAIGIAPGFRDKFDLSEKKHFADWADMAWTGAEAFLERKIEATRAANKTWEKQIEKADALARTEAPKEVAK